MKERDYILAGDRQRLEMALHALCAVMPGAVSGLKSQEEPIREAVRIVAMALQAYDKVIEKCPS